MLLGGKHCTALHSTWSGAAVRRLAPGGLGAPLRVQLLGHGPDVVGLEAAAAADVAPPC